MVRLSFDPKKSCNSLIRLTKIRFLHGGGNESPDVESVPLRDGKCQALVGDGIVDETPALLADDFGAQIAAAVHSRRNTASRRSTEKPSQKVGWLSFIIQIISDLPGEESTFADKFLGHEAGFGRQIHHGVVGDLIRWMSAASFMTVRVRYPCSQSVVS